MSVGDTVLLKVNVDNQLAIKDVGMLSIATVLLPL